MTNNEDAFVAVNKRISEVIERLLQLEKRVSWLEKQQAGGDYSNGLK